MNNILLDRLLEKFSPPLEPALVIALHSDFIDLPSEQDIESELNQLLSQLINEQQEQQEHHSLIDQIQAILPDLPLSTIYQTINHSTQPLTLEQIINLLLSPESNTLKHSNRKIKNQKVKNTFDTIHLNDVRQRDTQRRLNQHAQRYREEVSINNDWVIGDSQINYLANLLDIPINKIKSIYHRHNCNIVLSLEELLNQLESDKRSKASKDQEEYDKTLQLQLDYLRTTLLYEDDQILSRLLIVTDLNPNNALDLWIFLDELHARYGTLPFNQFISSHHTSSSSTHQPQPTQSNQSYPSSSSSSNPKPSNQFTHPAPNRPQYSTQQIQNSLTILRNRRQHLQQRSHSSRQLIANTRLISHNKQAIQNTIALISADEARQLNHLIQDWDLQLARQTVESRQKLRNDFLSIDLHGLTKSQALAITADHLKTWWSNHSHSVNILHSSFVHHFKIVTGAGTHSINNKPTLLPTIVKFLDQEKWKWKFDDERSTGLVGSILVVGKSRA